MFYLGVLNVSYALKSFQSFVLGSTHLKKCIVFLYRNCWPDCQFDTHFNQ